MFRTFASSAAPVVAAGIFDDRRLRALAVAEPLPLFRAVASSLRGLTEAEATQRLQDCGENRSAVAADPGWWARARAAVASPFVALLSVLCVVFGAIGDLRGVLTVAVMVLLSVGLRFWQHRRSDRAVRALRARVRTTATVRRRADQRSEPVEREVPVEDLVPGDVVVLGAGDVVAADVRVVAAADLMVDQSGLSGETLPVRKRLPGAARRRMGRTRAATDLASLCFGGTSVVGGSGVAVVIATGADTYFGALAAQRRYRGTESSFDRGVRAVGWTLVRFMCVMAPIVLVVNGAITGDWAQAAMFAVAVAVGLTPEMLPVIVTTNLVRGALRLAGHHVIVTRLNAIQDLGAIDVLCVDKTGTLTEDRVAYAHSIDARGHPDGEAAEYAYLAAYFQQAPYNRLDEAIVAQLADEVEDVLTDAVFGKVAEIPFDDRRRRSSVIVRRADERILITKGDPERVLPRCVAVQRDGDTRPLDTAQRRDILELVRTYAEHGMRVLAVAARRDPTGLGAEAERELVLVGFVGFVDPIRAGVAEAVDDLGRHGVTVKVLTGDNRHVAARVAEQAGLGVGAVVVGKDVDAADETALRALAKGHTVFAALTPAHKARLVAALRGAGHAVGVLGDGVNDATALRAADVGISVDTATEVAKDAADLILTERDLGVLARGVVEGRRTLGNTLKYVTITAASNFGNVLTVLAAGAFLPFLPVLPIQLVVANLLYDSAQLALPWDRVDPGYLRAPRRWDATGLARFMLVFGSLSSLFDLATFAMLWWVLGLGTAPAVFETGWFVEGLLSQLLAVLLLRSTNGFLSGRPPARPVLLAAAAVAAVGVLLPISPLAAALRLHALPAAYFPWLAVVLLGYGLATVLVKRLYLRYARNWL